MIARNKLGARAGYRMEFPLSAQNRRNLVGVPVSYRAKLHGRAFRPYNYNPKPDKPEPVSMM